MRVSGTCLAWSTFTVSRIMMGAPARVNVGPKGRWEVAVENGVDVTAFALPFVGGIGVGERQNVLEVFPAARPVGEVAQQEKVALGAHSEEEMDFSLPVEPLIEPVLEGVR